MTLTIHTEEDEQRQLLMTVEVPEERVEKGMRQAARKLARDYNFPGFRKGKAPYGVILRRIGRDAIRTDVIEDLVQPILEEAVEQVEAEVYGPPSLDDMEMEPLVFKYTVPLPPTVELGAYRELRKEIEPVVVEDKAVQEALEQTQARHQQVEEVDRAAEQGDLVTVSGKGVLVAKVEEKAEDDEAEESEEAAAPATDETIFEEESVDLLMDSEKLFAGTPFVDNVIGMSAGDSKSFGFDFPEDFEETSLAGREASFEIEVLNVKSRELPALDDELAKLDGNHETLDELRDALRQNLEEQAKAAAKNELIEGMIDDILENASLLFPPAAVEMEIDGMVQNFKEQVTRSGWSWEDYLKLQGGQESAVREQFREQAEESTRRRLILRQLVVEEKLTVGEADIEASIEERVASFADNEELKESMSKYFRSGYGFEMISSEILMDKVHDRITAILTGEAPDLDVEEATEESSEEEE